MKVTRVKPRRIKNTILKTITWVAVIGEILAICAIDSASIIPIIVAVICLVWIALFFIANAQDT